LYESFNPVKFPSTNQSFFFERERERERETEISFTICQNRIAINVYLDYINNCATPRGKVLGTELGELTVQLEIPA